MAKNNFILLLILLTGILGEAKVIAGTNEKTISNVLNYRLSGEAKYPAQIEDCKAAVRFLRANAEKYQCYSFG